MCRFAGDRHSSDTNLELISLCLTDRILFCTGYQPHAALSLAWIARTGVARNSAIIDIGGGASTLVDDLLAAGYTNLTVLDLSGAAIKIAQQRLGLNARQVIWREADVTTTELPEYAFDIWHDRAVFHFLTEVTDRKAYVEQLRRAVKPGGHIIIVTFSLEGLTRCSGLPIAQYSAQTLSQKLGAYFELGEHANERHVTPSCAEQTICLLSFYQTWVRV